MTPEAPTPRRARVALIGVHGYARIYLGLLQAAHNEGRVDIVAATVLERERHLPATRDLVRRGAALYGDYASMLHAHRGELDLCLIPTGIQWHARMAIAALEAGANVLVEKPLAGSLDDARSVMEIERKTNRWVAVGFQDLYVSEVEWMKRELIAGHIGRIQSVSMLGLWPRSRGYFERNHWAGRLRVDGAAAMDSPLNNALAHFANLALFLAGPAQEQSAEVEVISSELLRAHDIESFDTAVIRARSHEGVEFWFGMSHACRYCREPVIRLTGTRGTAYWQHENDCAILPDNEPEMRKSVPDYPTTRQAMFDAVFAKLFDPSVRICGTSIASRHTALVDAVHKVAPITTIAAALVDWQPGSDGEASAVPAIAGIEEALGLACEKASTLSETGFKTPIETRP